MNIVGLDLSLTSTGICYPDGLTDTIAVTTRGMERIGTIWDHIEDTVTGPGYAKHGIDLVAIEGYAYGRRNGGERLGELGGVIRHELHKLDIPVVEIPPSSLKKWATGKGNASKDLVVAAIAARTGIPFATSDECDAWCLWAMTSDQYGDGPVVMPAAHRVALDQIEWPHIGPSA